MSIIGNNILAGASGQAGGYEIQRSLRLNEVDTAYLRKSDFGTPDSSTTFTFSAWVKRGNIGTDLSIAGSDSGSNAFTLFGFDSADKLVWRVRNSSQSDLTRLESEAVFRDSSAWYHVLLQRDSTQSTPADRAKLWVNGVQLTEFSTNNTDESNMTYTSDFLQDINIGRFQVNSSTRRYSDGYVAEYYYIDGTALDPSSFTETDPTTGQLIPKEYDGSFGSNGFYLNFSDNSDITATTLGKDSSGNGNNFTPSTTISVTAGTGNDSLEDTPTNNWCTLNPLNTDNVSTFSNGNLDTVCNNASTSGGSIAVNSGKWYAEVVCTAKTASNAMVGICTIDGFDGQRQVDESQNGGSGHGYVMNATKLPGGASYGATWAIDDVIGIALDLDSAQNTVTFYKNGTSQGAININNAEYVFACSNGQGSSTVTYTYNFGQRAFTYTPPTGFKALNTANLPVPTVKNGTEYMQTVLYTGNAAVRDITVADNQSTSWSPDWVWIKGRGTTSAHTTYDSVRGATKYLRPDTDINETTDADTLTAFNSNGFSLGADVKVNTNNYTYVSWNWDAGANSSKTFTVKVVSDSGNKYRFDDFGTSAVTLDLEEGSTYVFDQSDSSNSGHPLRFSTTSDGTHNSGSEYTTGVTTTGTPGSAGAKTTIVVAASAPTLYYYCSSHSGMGGQANTNDTTGASNFAGSIQSTVRANVDAGFSIVSYTSNGTSGATVGHGLGVAPGMILVKMRTNQSVGTDNWAVFHKSLGATKNLWLDVGNSENTSSAYWNDTEPTSSVFSLGNDLDVNHSNGYDYIALVFSEVEGYSKFGSYTGNGGQPDGTFVYTGFKPAWLMIKKSSAGDAWLIIDNKRNTFNFRDTFLKAEDGVNEGNYNITGGLDFLSNGFKLRDNDGGVNGTSATYVYMAFAEAPFRHATAS